MVPGFCVLGPGSGSFTPGGCGGPANFPRRCRQGFWLLGPGSGSFTHPLTSLRDRAGVLACLDQMRQHRKIPRSVWAWRRTRQETRLIPTGLLGCFDHQSTPPGIVVTVRQQISLAALEVFGGFDEPSMTCRGSLEQSPQLNFKNAHRSDEGRRPDILAPAFNRTRERTTEAGPQGQLFLGPTAFLAEPQNGPAKLLSNFHGVPHTHQPARESTSRWETTLSSSSI